MKEALKLALEALEQLDGIDTETECVTIDVGNVITAIKEALAQPEQEPVAFGMLRADGLILDVICPDEHESFAGEYTIPLYTTPPKRLWVGLTDEQFQAIKDRLFRQDGGWDGHGWDLALKEAVEAKLKEKNT